MEQKEVKIIGLKLNQHLGILEACDLTFDPNNKLIAIKGEVGSGKTTLQKSMRLGSDGSDTLKADKQLYGEIDQEMQLIDGELKIFVGCKSNKSGGLDYVLYIKDVDGNVIKDPVIDGVKATPAKYLKNMQTELTWRMDELVSENNTIQRNLLLELYKEELLKVGVIFDQKNKDYSDSILGKIERAENVRSEKEFKRKQVGGFKNQLESIGIDIDQKSTWPKRVDIEALESKRNKEQYKLENVEQEKQQTLRELKNKADEIVLEIKKENDKIKDENLLLKQTFDLKKDKFETKEAIFSDFLTDFNTLNNDGFFHSVFMYDKVVSDLRDNFNNEEPKSPIFCQQVKFSDDGKVISSASDWNGNDKIKELLSNLDKSRKDYITEYNKPAGDTTEIEAEVERLNHDILLAKETNKKVDMIDSYLEWDEANKKVQELRQEYFEKLKSINTGVKGLEISVSGGDLDEENADKGKKDIHLTYNGAYDSAYFGNPQGESRKVSSYSGTQKTVICLLLQSYLLSKKSKAMRYLWIDNVPIDNKTKKLLEKMGKELGLTVIVNITGDFDRKGLESGELLVEGGKVFFQK